ncbi:DUF1569 domain-containing protein [Pedobacter sp. Leaf194]|uniref:DUF1569 domain-containing protein n=1 Tax=Pedobacter sp. Leaf194 TaxID=1736297 RepID=UPI00070371B3|nr:DUF1569 domain-containing protein [Pedobacter sp. Leaf194]KQS35870.1 hypothetical protein ASG14_10440 [Pedobacter sp. Leaf194]
MKNIFQAAVTSEVIERINKLNPSTPQQWGKMNVSQMLAHCSVSYEMVYENKHPKPNALMKLMLKAFVKNVVVSEKPYKRNSHTAPSFIITDEKEFEKEKNRLILYLQQTQELGESHFDGKESLSFGKLTKGEWNNMFYKHLDHHLNQFGV